MFYKQINIIYLFTFRKCLLSIVLITFVTGMTYMLMGYSVLSVIPRLISTPTVQDPEVHEALNTILPSQQIHVHFYNPPSWFKASLAFRGCRCNCSMTVGRGDYSNKTAVIFFGPLLGPLRMTKTRGQIWILHGRESPAHHHHLHKWRGLFNWTMTYRRDSDFPHYYGKFWKVSSPSIRLPSMTKKFAINVNRTKTSNSRDAKASQAAWFVSQCRVPSRRQDYVKSLASTYPVDIFGACGKERCSRTKEYQCLSMLSENYKFYLSFENSLCRDYITEKSFKIYTHDIDTVPITRGIGDLYSMYLPPGSFINTVGYKGINQLGHFLNYLNKNSTFYSQYFKWRKAYREYYSVYDSFCELCIRLHQPDVYSRYRRLYNDIDDWAFGSANQSMCIPVTDLNR